MKKLPSSLPSTKPDHFCQSQSSQLETIKNPKPNYTLQLQSLLASMAEVVKIRSVLLPRDIEAIFDEHQQFFSQFLEVQTKSQLWQLVADKRETELNEQKQISLLIKILQKLNKKRLQAADSGNSYLSDQLRKIVDWFINEILKYQSSVALKKQSQAISRLSEKGKLRRLSYQVQEKRMIQSFQESDKARQEKMLNRFKREQQFRQMQVSHKINDEIYKFNPSALTKQVKSKSLMKKLGPYRMNKSNPYEDKGYVTDINHTLHEEEARRMTVIDHYKKVERQKLVKQQSNLFETQKIHWDHQRNKMHTTLDKGRTELEYNQQKIKENMIHSFEMSRKRKLGELKKTLDAYVKHEDSIKIKEVMTEHEEKIRHTTDLREIGLPQSILKHIPGRYATICGKAEHSGESQARRHERFFESRIHKIMRQQSQQKQLLAGRKSLVDMYDNSLMPV